jgi:membrane protein implicated in regulation of membrane protease activity
VSLQGIWDGFGGAGGAWLIAALVLGLAELAIPGVFLVFLAIAAAVTGAIAFAVPGLPGFVQLLAFALWSGTAVLIGRRWYGRYPVESEDALLNDRAGRLVGQVVTVEAAIARGHGRVRIGDGAWPARGPDLPAGAGARIVAVRDGVVEVEATAATPDGSPA